MVVDAVVAAEDWLAAIWARRAEGEEALQRRSKSYCGGSRSASFDELYPCSLDDDRCSAGPAAELYGGLPGRWQSGAVSLSRAGCSG